MQSYKSQNQPCYRTEKKSHLPHTAHTAQPPLPSGDSDTVAGTIVASCSSRGSLGTPLFQQCFSHCGEGQHSEQAEREQVLA